MCEPASTYPVSDTPQHPHTTTSVCAPNPVPVVNSGGETPGPIPNPEAKPANANGTAPGRMWESRKPPTNNNTNKLRKTRILRVFRSFSLLSAPFATYNQPKRSAARAAAYRFVVLVFARTDEIWLRTVPSERCIVRAIERTSAPVTARRHSSFSRAVSGFA